VNERNYIMTGLWGDRLFPKWSVTLCLKQG